MATSDFPPTTSSDQLTGLKQAPWESKYHWLCRRKFIEDHKTRYDLKRVISLSMVWANYNLLGCTNSEKDLVLYYPVPDQSEIDRWLKVHKDILDDDHQMITAVIHNKQVKLDKPVNPQSSISKNGNQSNDHTHLSEPIIPKLTQTYLCLKCARTDHPVTKLSLNTVECLPREIWLTILVNYGLTAKDLANLEISCKWFSQCWGGNDYII